MDTLTLTYRQRRHLERQLRSTRDARVYRRTLAVLEVVQGEPVAPVAPVARRLRVTRRAVYRGVATYGRDHAPDALADRDRSGRPRLLTPADRDRLRELLGRSPQEMGYFAAQWTVPWLREHLTRSTGRRSSGDTLRRELRRLRYAWKRSRYTLDPDPEPGGKKGRILRQIRRSPARSVVLAEGGTDLPLFPPLRAAWPPRGHPEEVLLCGRNGRRVVFGAMNVRTGHRLLLPREHQRAADPQAFLRVVHGSYRGWHVAMLLGDDPSHTAKGSVRSADAFGIEALWLPKRAPELNPMDTLWGQAKDVVSADKQYTTLEGQVERFIAYLESLSPGWALKTAGVYADDSWLGNAL